MQHLGEWSCFEDFYDQFTLVVWCIAVVSREIRFAVRRIDFVLWHRVPRQHLYESHFNLSCTIIMMIIDDVLDEAKHPPVFVSLFLCYSHYIIAFILLFIIYSK